MSAGSSQKRVSTTTLDKFIQQENTIFYPDEIEQELVDDPSDRDINVTDSVFDSQEIETGLTTGSINGRNVNVITIDEENTEIQEGNQIEGAERGKQNEGAEWGQEGNSVTVSEEERTSANVSRETFSVFGAIENLQRSYVLDLWRSFPSERLRGK